MSQFQAYTIMFFMGGFLYCSIEVLARGYSHISMFLAGAVCFLLVGVVEAVLGSSASVISQMFFCGLMITFVELIIGLVVNRYMHLNVWDYSGQQYNFMGQICLLYSNLWILLSGPMIFLHDYMEYLLLGSKIPEYHLF
ncbi:MAG: putative ABC transporter permease [Clostridiaceae bacterium]|nr:putative ABC transporter permease [Clostridiaceae bacterium]